MVLIHFVFISLFTLFALAKAFDSTEPDCTVGLVLVFKSQAYAQPHSKIYE